MSLEDYCILDEQLLDESDTLTEHNITSYRITLKASDGIIITYLNKQIVVVEQGSIETSCQTFHDLKADLVAPVHVNILWVKEVVTKQAKGTLHEQAVVLEIGV
jgi:hypothetical protein